MGKLYLEQKHKFWGLTLTDFRHISVETATYLMGRYQIYQNCIQKLLRYCITFTNNRTHKVYHVHMNFLIVAIAAIQNKVFRV